MAFNQCKHDSALICQLYIQYIGTEVHGSNIFKKYRYTKNGYNPHKGLCGHYNNKSYLTNKATEAKKKIKTLAYCGDITIFNIDEYYKVLQMPYLI